MRKLNAWVAIIGLVLAPALVAVAGSADDAYRAAVQAFEAGRYDLARDRFLEARKAGMDTAALSYSLGSTWYRLGAYPQAAEEFRRLLGDPQWEALAHYNLGLVARRQGDETAARGHFRAAARSPDAGLAHLAARALEPDEGPPPVRGAGLLSLGVGHDSNVTLSPDAEFLAVSDDADSFMELLAAGRLYLTPDAPRPLRLDGSILLRDYSTVDRFDETSLMLGLFQESRLRAWRLQWGGGLDVAYLDGRSFQEIYSLKGEGRRHLGAGQDLRLHYSLSRIEADAPYDYLTGWRHRMGGEWRLPVGGAPVRLGYRLDLNDRRDLEQDGEFASYSATRHALYAQASTDLDDRVRLRGRVEYHHSVYNDPHRLEGLTRTREDDLWWLSLRGAYHLDRSWAVFADLSYAANDSSLREYDYDRSVVMGGIEYVFGR
jgi:tetratricopeptide (TPR) repeat protein